jgi:quercetin dioxygenase-like cupin family protein
MTDEPTDRRPVVLGPEEGRAYDMGRIQATFKADGVETAGAYSISTWRLEANTTGPGPHQHPEDDVFFVTEGTMSLLVDGEWIDAPTGAFVAIPAGMVHDFQNRSDAPATILNFSSPGDFEDAMPGIVDWFAEHPAGDARP